MLDRKSEKITILREALMRISQEKEQIKLTKEDIEKGTNKFINYTNLTLKSEEIKEDIVLSCKIQPTYNFEESSFLPHFSN
jgi:hypothetical protein